MRAEMKKLPREDQKNSKHKGLEVALGPEC